jgi:DNA-binding response OmpR family regulator
MNHSANAQRTILLVDDDLAIRETTSDLLMLAGATVFTAASGQEAMKLLTNQSVDLIVTDLVMPNGDGNWLVTQVRASTSNCKTPIIMLSAHTTQRHVDTGLKLGVDIYLFKPFDPAALISTVEKFLQAPQGG